LKRYLYIFFSFFFLSTAYLSAQVKKDSTLQLKEGDVDVNFLFNYYKQEGIHAAVTGGEGTEELEDQDVSTVIIVPLDSITNLDVKVGFNHYSSASTDRIDSRLSTASAKDNRVQIQMGYERLMPAKRQSWNIGVGGSLESDYFSSSVSGGYTWDSKDGNRQINLQLQAFLDTWVVIFPEELRVPGLAEVPTDKRRSFNLSISWSQVINQRLQIALASDIVYQQGLLSTPFHRVYFRGVTLPRIESLPTRRLKVPLSIRANYFLSDFFVLRSYYRFYYDDFEIMAHTASMELPIKLGNTFTIYPHYRYHTQSAATWFAPFAEHFETETFYTSDYDLSAFNSHNYGIGLSFAPVYGISRFRVNSRGRLGFFKSVDLRYSQYQRSDGLSAFSLGLDFAFRL